MNKKDIKNSSFAYSLNMLRVLHSMKLITEEEYKNIIEICSDYYGIDSYSLII